MVALLNAIHGIVPGYKLQCCDVIRAADHSSTKCHHLKLEVGNCLDDTSGAMTTTGSHISLGSLLSANISKLVKFDCARHFFHLMESQWKGEVVALFSKRKFLGSLPHNTDTILEKPCNYWHVSFR